MTHSVEPDPRNVPERIGPYRIVSEIGRGGMGIVYQAVDEPTGRTVALKILPGVFALDRKTVERFRREARAAARLNHPAVVSLYDVGQVGGIHFLVMERLAGPSLRDRIRAGTLPDLSSCVQAIMRVGEALVMAHEQGILHRDLTPANLIYRAGNDLCLTDFGLAKLEGEASLTFTGEGLGTPSYMAPEQTEGKEPDERTDVYGLGLTLWETVTGRRAFDQESVAATLRAVREIELPAARACNKEVSPELSAVIRKATSKNPDARYATMKEFVTDLGRAARGEATQVRPMSWFRSALYRADRALSRAGHALVSLFLVQMGVLASILMLIVVTLFRSRFQSASFVVVSLFALAAFVFGLLALGQRRWSKLLGGLVALATGLLIVIELVLSWHLQLHHSLGPVEGTLFDHGWDRDLPDFFFSRGAEDKVAWLDLGPGMLAVVIASVLYGFLVGAFKRVRAVLAAAGIVTVILVAEIHLARLGPERCSLYLLLLLGLSLAGFIAALRRWLPDGYVRDARLSSCHLLLLLASGATLGWWAIRDRTNEELIAVLRASLSDPKTLGAWEILNAASRDDQLGGSVDRTLLVEFRRVHARTARELEAAFGGPPTCASACSLSVDLILHRPHEADLERWSESNHGLDVEVFRASRIAEPDTERLRQAMGSTRKLWTSLLKPYTYHGFPGSALARFVMRDDSIGFTELTDYVPRSTAETLEGLRRAPQTIKELGLCGIARQEDPAQLSRDILQGSRGDLRAMTYFWMGRMLDEKNIDRLKHGLSDRDDQARILALHALSTRRETEPVEALHEFLSPSNHIDADLPRCVGALARLVERGGDPAMRLLDEYEQAHGGHRCGLAVQLVRLALGDDAPIPLVEQILKASIIQAAMENRYVSLACTDMHMATAIAESACRRPRRSLRSCMIMLFALGHSDRVAEAWRGIGEPDAEALREITEDPVDLYWAAWAEDPASSLTSSLLEKIQEMEGARAAREGHSLFPPRPRGRRPNPQKIQEMEDVRAARTCFQALEKQGDEEAALEAGTRWLMRADVDSRAWFLWFGDPRNIELADRIWALADRYGIPRVVRGPEVIADAIRLVRQRRFEFEKALELYETALEIYPSNIWLMNDYAWLMAIHLWPSESEPSAPTPSDRTRRAVEVAERAVESAQGEENLPLILDTLAAAYYSDGQIENAVKTQEIAVQGVDPRYKEEFTKRLEAYRRAMKP